MKERVLAASKFSLKHLVCSVCVAVACALLVFGLWYPYPYGELASGRALFLLLISVDLIVGPLLSLVIYNPKKNRSELFRDIGVVVALQLAALTYGLYSVTQARPVLLAFEGDRFRVVSVPDINKDDLGKASLDLARLSWTGPKLMGVKLLGNSDSNFLASIRLSMQGVHPAFRPERWVSYDTQRVVVVQSAKKLKVLKGTHPSQSALIDSVVKKSGLAEDALGYLPLSSEHHTDWVVIVDLENAQPKAFLPLDGW